MKRFCMSVLVLIILMGWANVTSAQNVTFTDNNLAAAVRTALGLSPGATIPLTQLQTLRELSASSQSISNLNGLEHATNLEQLYLWDNQISNISVLSGLTKLWELALSTNQISDISPLAGLTNLTYLELFSNQISNISSLSSLTSLEQLHIFGNQISDITTLASLPNLTALWIGGNQISDISHLVGLANLTALGLGGNQINDLSHLAGLTKLTTLYLGENLISDISHLASLTNLQTLAFDGNLIRDIRPLAGLTKLTTLYLSANFIRDIRPLAGLTNLQTLHLTVNQISDITPLAGLMNLQTLHLGTNPIRDTTPLLALPNLLAIDIDLDKSLKAPKIIRINFAEDMSLIGKKVGDPVDVAVTFEGDGTRFYGSLPYVVVYLGKRIPENERKALWHSTEDANSTKVIFRYTVQPRDDTSSISIKLNSLTVPIGSVITDDAGNRIFTPAGEKLRTFSTPAPPSSIRELRPSPVAQDRVIFNELRNASDDTHDWIELKNISDAAVSLKDWEISIVTPSERRMFRNPEDAGQDFDAVAFPAYTLPAGGILLITNTPPADTDLIHGQDITDPDRTPDGLPQYLVAPEMMLPNTPYLLILRSATDKNGKPEAVEDVFGTYFRSTTAYHTEIWPLKETLKPRQELVAPLTAGEAWQRVGIEKRGYLKEAWTASGYQSGLGYQSTASLATSLGTPGYPNDTVVDESLIGRITFSELMFATNGGLFSLPQWIELFNNTPIAAMPINLKGWKLVVEARESDAWHRYSVIELGALDIAPDQTVLLVTRNRRHSEQLSADQVYDLWHHSDAPRLGLRENTVLSTEGFALKLFAPDGTLVDSAGNLDGEKGKDDPTWELPSGRTEDGARTSLIRLYTDDGALAGTEATGWARAADLDLPVNTYYGHETDIGTPGYREGGAAPVLLSQFRASRTDAGVLLEWVTQSEVDNAGFFIKRSQQRNGQFKVINATMIPGAGTTSEKQSYTYMDTTTQPNVVYYYQIEDVSLDGNRQTLTRGIRLRGHIGAAGKATTTWGELKMSNE